MFPSGPNRSRQQHQHKTFVVRWMFIIRMGLRGGGGGKSWSSFSGCYCSATTKQWKVGDISALIVKRKVTQFVLLYYWLLLTFTNSRLPEELHTWTKRQCQHLQREWLGVQVCCPGSRAGFAVSEQSRHRPRVASPFGRGFWQPAGLPARNLLVLKYICVLILCFVCFLLYVNVNVNTVSSLFVNMENLYLPFR